MYRAPQSSICRALQTCICKASSALAAGHRRAPVSCRAYLRPPLCSGLSASGLPCCQGARSLRDRQPPTALPALDRTSTRRHRANNRPKDKSALRPAYFTCAKPLFRRKSMDFRETDDNHRLWVLLFRESRWISRKWLEIIDFAFCQF